MAEKIMKEFTPDIYSKYMLMSPGDSFTARKKAGDEFTFRRESHTTGKITIKKVNDK